MTVPLPGTIDRRTFLRRGALGASALWSLSLGEFSARRGYGDVGVPGPYGPLRPAVDETTGLTLLAIPEGFRYLSYGWAGEAMSDGLLCPRAHDGMAVIDSRPGTHEIVLVRNHEIEDGTPFTTACPTYSREAGGGTTNLVFDQQTGAWKSSWASLAGTWRNCAGGVTPWGTWISGEETARAGHGWCFEVGSTTGSPEPLRGMGRFAHEALMVDPASGFVYETEDAGPMSGFYRFVPHEAGRLAAGGDLFMLKVKGRANAKLGVAFPPGTTWDIEWVRIDDPLATVDSPFEQGSRKGAAAFQRLEGAWWGDRTGYFISTCGGRAQSGQVFELDPEAGTLRLIYDSPSAEACDYPDNMTVTPRGGLLLCEDSGNTGSPHERLIGLTLDGNTFTFAANMTHLARSRNAIVRAGDYRKGEFAGCCFSPDGRWLFVNMQAPGITLAITGPWGAGPL